MRKIYYYRFRHILIWLIAKKELKIIHTSQQLFSVPYKCVSAEHCNTARDSDRDSDSALWMSVGQSGEILNIARPAHGSAGQPAFIDCSTNNGTDDSPNGTDDSPNGTDDSRTNNASPNGTDDTSDVSIKHLADEFCASVRIIK